MRGRNGRSFASTTNGSISKQLLLTMPGPTVFDAGPMPAPTTSPPVPGPSDGGRVAASLAAVPRSARGVLPAAAAAVAGTEGSTITPRERALVLLRVAAIDRSPYWRTQAEGVASELGITADQVAVVETDEWETVPAFDERERGAILWADRVARRLARRDRQAYETVRAVYAEHEIVELTLVASLAAMHTRLANALRIEPEPPAGLVPRRRPVPDEAFRSWSASMFDDGTEVVAR